MAAEKYTPKPVGSSEAKVWLDAMRWAAKTGQTDMPDVFYHAASGEIMVKDGPKYRPQTKDEYQNKPFGGYTEQHDYSQ